MPSATPDPRRPDRLGLGRQLADAGFNAAGVLGRDDYDARVPPGWRASRLHPATRSVVVLACGGRAFGEALHAAHPDGPIPPPAQDPVEGHTRRTVGGAAARLAAAGFPTRAAFASERHDGAFADFVALGRACGLGHPSRLGLLLHPEYGPWLAIRALLLTARALPPTPPLPGPGPCHGCPAPCRAACPGDAPADDGFDVAACARTRRREDACALRCAARHACVVGSAHAYAPEIEAHHMRAAVAHLV